MPTKHILLTICLSIPCFSQVTKDLVTDFGATCDGSASDAPAFRSFLNWGLTWQTTNTGRITLISPPGKTCLPGAGFILSGIKNLLVSGYGSTWTDGGGYFALGSYFPTYNGFPAHDCRTATVNIGATFITCLDRTGTSFFTVGQWALMTGLDMQGGGYPANPAFHDYVLVSDVDSTTGEVTFSSTPLKNSYESTWPLYQPGTPGVTDQGGPATLYQLDPSWNTSQEYDGLIISQANETGATGRTIIFKDVTFPTAMCAYPSQNETYMFVNVTTGDRCSVQADKLIDTFYVIDSVINQITFQSSSLTSFIMSGSTVTSILGTPQNTVITNSKISGSLGLGTFAYGRAVSFMCYECTLPVIGISSITDKGGPAQPGANNYYAMNNGVIVLPNSSAVTNGPVSWAIPGATMFWISMLSNAGLPFKVVDVTQDATNTYIQTTLQSGFPPLPKYMGQLWLRVHPAPQFTCIACVGAADALDLSQATPGLPIYSYTKRTYTGNIGSDQPSVNIWGRLVSMTIDVITPYTGSQSTLTMSAMGKYGYQAINPQSASQTFVPTINLKAAGIRTIFPDSVLGQQLGDSGLSVPGPIWLGGAVVKQYKPHVDVDISADCPSACPTVSIEIVTDQSQLF